MVRSNRSIVLIVSSVPVSFSQNNAIPIEIPNENKYYFYLKQILLPGGKYRK